MVLSRACDDQTTSGGRESRGYSSFLQAEGIRSERAKGKFGDNFWNLVKGISDDNLVKGISGDNLGKWMEALDFVSQRIGFVFNEKSNNEADFINNIVEKVMTEIIRISIKQIEKSHDYYLLSELKKDTSTDSSTSEVPSRKQAKAKLVKVKEICSSCSKDGKVKPPNTQVFINFRGEQLRNSFVGYLVAALRGSGINVFIDNHEQRGEDLKTLFKRIEDSGIAIVVFSSKYTESKWCLDELVKIQERVDQGLLKVLPIFYKVTPDNVKRLKGEFGDHFRDKEYMYRFEEPKIKRWKEAILFVSSRFALAYDEKSVLEIDFIDTIVKGVLKMLKAFSTVESGQSSS